MTSGLSILSAVSDSALNSRQIATRASHLESIHEAPSEGAGFGHDRDKVVTKS